MCAPGQCGAELRRAPKGGMVPAAAARRAKALRRAAKAAAIRGGVGMGGWCVLVLHLLSIQLGVIDPMGPLATGTLTVLSWFAGWMAALYIKGQDDPIVRIEAAVILAALFQLAVGAGAFSRVYYGWIAGHDRDLFHSLSLVYLREDPLVPEEIVTWWEASSTARFTGLGWYICELADICAHQVPFVLMLRITKNTGIWDYILDHVWTVWPLVAIAGPLHRGFWDLATCGHLCCDGPYRGFLASIPPLEQFLWHFLPCVILLAYLAEVPLVSRSLYMLEKKGGKVLEEGGKVLEESLHSLEGGAVKMYQRAKVAAEAAAVGNLELDDKRPC